MDPRKDVVRRGYDALSHLYRGDDEEPEHYATWVAELRRRVPGGGAVLDLGCGWGVPLARDLVASGYAITGVDLSAVRISRARQLVPTARFLHADATQISFPPSSFDAVVSLYALIHIPLDEQPLTHSWQESAPAGLLSGRRCCKAGWPVEGVEDPHGWARWILAGTTGPGRDRSARDGRGAGRMHPRR